MLCPNQQSLLPFAGEARGQKSLVQRDEPTIWYEAAAALPPLPASASATPALGSIDPDLYENCRVKAEALLEQEAAAYEREMSRRNASDAKWLAQVKRSGTTADKLAAATLLVQVG